ncbi:hypothetical protein WJX81_000086 [Elliptochloris bilobata]|uniref:DUF4332 domain-containing protein n=1 Tax=Elliptochloris bilobata TaxID=381761 RepID=A0AAW1QY62_9CHLO
MEKLNRPGLLELEKWYYAELPQIVGKRGNKHVTGAELAKLMEWKLARSKWRPRLQAYVEALPAEAVVEASTAAFAALGPSAENEAALKSAINALTVLKGVGPATASAVLSAGDSAAPFMSDEALAMLGGSKAYTLKKYLELAAALQAKARELSPAERVWTARDVERALFSASAEGMQPKAGPAVAGGKRKR